MRSIVAVTVVGRMFRELFSKLEKGSEPAKRKTFHSLLSENCFRRIDLFCPIRLLAVCFNLADPNVQCQPWYTFLHRSRTSEAQVRSAILLGCRDIFLIERASFLFDES